MPRPTSRPAGPALAAPLFAATLLGASAMARAAEVVTLTLKDHRFTPAKVTVPAGERFRIEVTNADDTPEEFESADLRAEKVVVAGGRITLTAGPLKPGTYGFVGEYHADTARGTITAVPPAPGK